MQFVLTMTLIVIIGIIGLVLLSDVNVDDEDDFE